MKMTVQSTIAPENIGQLIKNWRENAYLNRPQLSRECKALGSDISCDTIRSWESGKRFPQPANLLTVLKVLNNHGIIISSALFDKYKSLDIHLATIEATQDNTYKSIDTSTNLLMHDDLIFDKAVKMTRATLKLDRPMSHNTFIRKVTAQYTKLITKKTKKTY